MKKVLAVASGKGGTGKTTAVANMGIGLAMLKYKVLVVDLDIGLRSLDLALGMENRVIYDLLDVLDGKCRVQEALLTHRNWPSLHLLPAAQNRIEKDFELNYLRALCADMTKVFDYIILDAPPGLGNIVLGALGAAERCLIISTPDPAALRDADRVAGEASQLGLEDVQLVVNKMRDRKNGEGCVPGLDEIGELMALPLLGVVPEDDRAIIASCKGEPVITVANSAAGKAWISIIERLFGKEVR